MNTMLKKANIIDLDQAPHKSCSKLFNKQCVLLFRSELFDSSTQRFNAIVKCQFEKIDNFNKKGLQNGFHPTQTCILMRFTFNKIITFYKFFTFNTC